jgi:hypothetical protein
MRNSRRSGLSLSDVVAVMDATIAAQFGPDKFVTAIVGARHHTGQLDLDHLWASAGLVVRGWPRREDTGPDT